MKYKDFSAPDVGRIFDDKWKRVPVFHISRAQLTAWRNQSAVPADHDGGWMTIRPPFQWFCIEIDDHAQTSNWSVAVDLEGNEVDIRFDGYVVAFEEEKMQWLTFERSTIRSRRNNGPAPFTYTALHCALIKDETTAVGGPRYSVNIPAQFSVKLSGDAVKRSEIAALRVVHSLCYLLGEHEWEAYDPKSALSRNERRALAFDEKKHNRTTTHYRIFLNRKKKRANDDGIGTGEPRKWHERVRGHYRTYKSGRRIWIKDFEKGIGKPQRPHPPTYDAWSLDDVDQARLR
jgi:hypothetical protein